MLSSAPPAISNLNNSLIDQETQSASIQELLSQHGSDYDVDLTVYQTPRASFDSLPEEVLIDIFQWLDIRSLDACGLVSRRWNRCISNDTVWRAAFLLNYGTLSFGRVTNSLSWKSETIERYDYLRHWKKNAAAAHVSFKLDLISITNLYVDFPAMRMIAFSTSTELGVIADPSKGKIAAPMLKTDGLVQNSAVTSCVSVSKFGVVYGFSSGKVSGVFFSKGTTVRTFVHFDLAHLFQVTCAWISKDVSPRDAEIGVVTGGEEGLVMIWNANNGTKLQEFRFSPEESLSSMIYLDSDSKSRIIIGTSEGEVYLWEKDSGNLTLIGRPIDFQGYFVFETDFQGGYVLVSNGSTILRHRITNDASCMETVRFECPDGEEHFKNIAMDKSPYLYANSSTTPKQVPGQCARYMIATGQGSRAYVWNLRASASSDGIIPLIHTVESPFHNPSDIARVAINSVVFAVSSYLGMVYVYNVLTGKRIQLVTVRFPRRLVDYNDVFPVPRLALQPHEIYPHAVFHLELDPDPRNPHGVVIVDAAVQYFDYGHDASKSKIKARGIKKRVPGKRSLHHSAPGLPRNEELLKEIDDEFKIMKDVHRDLAAEQRFRSPFIAEGLTEEEQLSYALMLSQDSEPPKDKDVEEAIKLSLQQSSPEHSPDPGPGSSSSHARVIREPGMSDEDWELQQAMVLSLQGGDAPSSSFESSDSEEKDFELALKLSMMDCGK